MPYPDKLNITAAGWELEDNLSVLGTFSASTFSPTSLTLGTGDNVSFYQSGTAHLEGVAEGTAAAPITVGTGPTLKIARTESILEAAMPGGIGANNQGNAAIWAVATGQAANEAQVAAGLFTSTNASTQSAHNDDACGVQGIGSVVGSGTGIGMGAYLEGRRDTATGNAGGLQVAVRNYTAVNGSYLSSGLSDTVGIWLFGAQGNGATKNGVGIEFGNPYNIQFDVGIGFSSQGTGGPITTSSIRDDSSAATSIQINGTHATGAIVVAAGSGHVGFGAAPTAGGQFKVQADVDNVTAGVFLAHSGSQSVNIFAVQDFNGGELFSIGSSGNMRLIDHDMVFGTTTGTKIGTLTTQKLAFYAATPVVQPNTTGTTTGFVASTGTTVVSGSTFTGNTGSTAYTIGDIVNGLKKLGLLAA